jgi:uncharacterized membrane protein
MARRPTHRSHEDHEAKPRLDQRLAQVRRMVERAEEQRERYETAGLTRLADEMAREKRYWQFVQAVLELRPWTGHTWSRGIVH